MALIFALAVLARSATCATTAVILALSALFQFLVALAAVAYLIPDPQTLAAVNRCP